MGQRVERAMTNVEILWVRIRSWIHMILPLLGMAIMIIGAYGMVNAGAIEFGPPIEEVVLPGYIAGLKSYGVWVSDWWFVSIPFGAVVSWFSLKL